MKKRTIYTLEARGNVLLEVTASRLGMDTAAMFDEINKAFDSLLLILQSKNIEYENLQKALIPQKDRKEIAFVFDSSLIASASYGYEIFSVIIPLLDKNSINSILVGDLMVNESFVSTFRTIFFNEINAVRTIKYVHPTLFYVVYLNNLSDAQFKSLNAGLMRYQPYLGYFDLSYASMAKTLISTMLVRYVVKYKGTLIAATEDSEDVNNTGYPFEQYGYTFKGVEDIYYGIFLSYKIEREIIKGFETDTDFSINAISKEVSPINDFKLVVQESKLGYLLEKKSGSMASAGLTNVSVAELETLIRRKISQNYIYNLTKNEEFNTIQFNIMIETPRAISGTPLKLLVGLKYIYENKELHLITMF